MATLGERQISVYSSPYITPGSTQNALILFNNAMIKKISEIPPRVEYQLTAKGQELTESIIDLLQWMIKWSSRQ